MDLDQVQQFLQYMLINDGYVECGLCSNGDYEFGQLDNCVNDAWNHICAYHPSMVIGDGLRLEHVSDGEVAEAIASIKKVKR